MIQAEYSSSKVLQIQSFPDVTTGFSVSIKSEGRWTEFETFRICD